jgi:hypothetical protein
LSSVLTSFIEPRKVSLVNLQRGTATLSLNSGIVMRDERYNCLHLMVFTRLQYLLPLDIVQPHTICQGHGTHDHRQTDVAVVQVTVCIVFM